MRTFFLSIDATHTALPTMCAGQPLSHRQIKIVLLASFTRPCRSFPLHVTATGETTYKTNKSSRAKRAGQFFYLILRLLGTREYYRATTRNSTRRLCARPSSVVLVSIGLDLPKPLYCRRLGSMPFRIRKSTTALARFSDKRWL